MRLVSSLRLRLRQLAATARRLVRERRGNVLMLTGLALIPLTFATGMAIDYSRAARLQTKLNAAADAAALSGVAKPMMNNTMLAACNAARRTFLNSIQQSAAGLTLSTTTNPTVVINETYAAGADVTLTCPKSDATVVAGVAPVSRSVTVSYAGTSSNAFSGVLGAASIEIGGTGTARSSIGQFIDIHMALDTSQSMGLAATDADALALWNKTKEVNGNNYGCTFGCHVFVEADSGKNSAQKSNETIASENNIKLRINSLRDATIDMIDEAIEKQSTPPKYRFGLYRIGASTSTISALSSDLAAARTTVQGLKLGQNTTAGTGDSHLQDMAKTMLSTITTHGGGTTAATASAYLFIVTDGVQDIYTSGGSYSFNGSNFNCEQFQWNHCMAVIKPADCQKLKNNNITVGIVYTTYLPVKSNPADASDNSLRHEYTGLVQNIASNIKPQLQACASDPKWFLEASDGPGIEAAMKKLLSQAFEAARLSQ